MSNFSYKNTYYEAIFDLRRKRKKSMLKSGIPNMIPEKKVLLAIHLFRQIMFFSSVIQNVIIIFKSQGSTFSSCWCSFYPNIASWKKLWRLSGLLLSVDRAEKLFQGSKGKLYLVMRTIIEIVKIDGSRI